MGVVHLMDMMTDMEALRNEVLLLLIGLTHSNQSIQQIAAFEGAFERLLNIIRSTYPSTGNYTGSTSLSTPLHTCFVLRCLQIAGQCNPNVTCDICLPNPR